MLKIAIQGLQNGEHSFEVETDAGNIADFFPEFTGKVVCRGTFQKLGNKYIVHGSAECTARLVCDLSNEEYDEAVKAEISATFTANTALFLEARASVGEYEQTYFLHDDDKEIDITEEVRQELIIQLPMKRIAPAFRDKKLEDVYPTLIDNTAMDDEPETLDPRWEALTKIKFTNN